MTEDELRLLIVLHALRTAFDQLAFDTETGALTLDNARQRAHDLLVDWRRALTRA